MGAFEEAKEWLVEAMGMWWPDADEGKLREAAGAWRDFADAVVEVRQAANNKAGALIENNSGEAIDAFEVFWHRYCQGGRGWLNDLERAARDMATALEDFADDLEDVKDKIDVQIAISAATIVAGIGLAVATAGAASGAAVAAATTITRLAASLGVAVSTNAARIAATTLVGAAFGGIESVAVNLAVAQPMRIHAGLQDGLELNQVGTAARDGMVFGGAFGAGYGTVRSLADGPWSPQYAELMDFGAMTSRGTGDNIPPPDEVLKALKESKPEVLQGRKWSSEDGRYYADRVLAGGREDGETVFAGHGYLEMNAGDVTVPPGTTISFYVEDGARIPGVNGLTIEKGVYPGKAVEVYGPGDTIPNYTLGPPEPRGPGGFTVYENSTTVAERTRIADLLKPDMGNVHWAACREYKS